MPVLPKSVVEGKILSCMEGENNCTVCLSCFGFNCSFAEGELGAESAKVDDEIAKRISYSVS